MTIHQHQWEEGHNFGDPYRFLGKGQHSSIETIMSLTSKNIELISQLIVGQSKKKLTIVEELVGIANKK